MRKSRFGFTLMELLIACVLFASLSIAVYSVLKNALDSTVRQKTQQNANDNAKNIMSAITADLKSSSVINSKLNLANYSNGSNGYQYPSSVVFPTTSHFSSADTTNLASTDNVNAIGLLNPGNTKYENDNVGANNKILFYAQRYETDNVTNTRNLITELVEYFVKLNTTDNTCSLERRTWVWDGSHAKTGFVGADGTWLGLQYVNSSGWSSDRFNINFVDSVFKDAVPYTYTTVCSLPNTGDCILLYTSRAFDDTYSPRVLAANQYNIKVIVFQTVKKFDTLYSVTSTGHGKNKNTTNNNDNILQIQGNFFKLFTKDLKANNHPDKSRRKNYRYCELNSIVTVRTSSLK